MTLLALGPQKAAGLPVGTEGTEMLGLNMMRGDKCPPLLGLSPLPVLKPTLAIKTEILE